MSFLKLPVILAFQLESGVVFMNTLRIWMCKKAVSFGCATNEQECIPPLQNGGLTKILWNGKCKSQRFHETLIW